MMKRFSLIMGIAILLAISFASADLTVTVSGSSNKTFSISQNATITSASLDVTPGTTNVTLNSNFLGDADGVSQNDLISNFLIGQNNGIGFSNIITNFDLTYAYHRTDGLCPTKDARECPNDATYFCAENHKKTAWKCYQQSTWNCGDNSDCNSGEDCLNNFCCSSQYPLNLIAQTTESCPNSDIPVAVKNTVTDTNCRSVPSSTSIDFWLGNTKVRSGCNLSGDSGWYLDDWNRCGVTVPATMATGTYTLRATYSIDGNNYDQSLGSITITAVCGTNVRCGHSSGLTQAVSPGTLTAAESFNDASTNKFLVPQNMVVTITGISTYQAQCSNGVIWNNDRPGIVAWTLNSGLNQIAVGDNSLFNGGTCKIPVTKSRDQLIGPGAWTAGYKPDPSCNMDLLNIKMGNSDTSSVYNFPNPGSFLVHEDYINAQCDSPDYVCPYVPTGATDSLCWIGTMKSVPRANGWVNLTSYNVIVVNPNISLTFVSSNFGTNQQATTFNYNITNTGIGKVNVSARINSSDLKTTYYPSNSVLNETQTITASVNILPQVPSNRTVYSVVPFNYSNVTLNNYSSYEFNETTLTVNYSVPLEIVYDDVYNFSSQPPQVIQQNINFSYNFECNGSYMQVVELKDMIFYCTCKDKGFCIQNKSTNNAPCACIDNPIKNLTTYNPDIFFNATRSFDDITPSQNVTFVWFFEPSNQAFYANNGSLGANFSWHFAHPGQYDIRLEARDALNASGIDRTSFFIGFDTPFCMQESGVWYWLENKTQNPSLDDCYRVDGNNTKECCPLGLDCGVNVTGARVCVTPDVPPEPVNNTPERCEEIMDQTNCTDADLSIAEKSINEKTVPKCGEDRIINLSCHDWTESCRCVWKSGKCISSSDYGMECNGVLVSNGTCEFASTNIADFCDSTDMKVVSWNASWNGTGAASPSCLNGEKEYPCAKGVALNFIGGFSLISIILIIISFYTYRIINKKIAPRQHKI